MVGLDIKGTLEREADALSACWLQLKRHWPKLTLVNPNFFPLRNRLCGTLGKGDKSSAGAPGSMNNRGLSKSHGLPCLHGRELTFDGDGEKDDGNI